MKDKIKKWYKMGLWTAGMVRNAVTKGKLTEDDAAEILVGELVPAEYGGNAWREV